MLQRPWDLETSPPESTKGRRPWRVRVPRHSATGPPLFGIKCHCVPSSERSAAMQEYILLKIAGFLVDIGVASIIALTLGFFAHYVFGFSRLDIRALALMGAGIIVGALWATEWFAKLRKSK